jgi:hypothetical protein
MRQAYQRIYVLVLNRCIAPIDKFNMYSLALNRLVVKVQA